MFNKLFIKFILDFSYDFVSYQILIGKEKIKIINLKIYIF